MGRTVSFNRPDGKAVAGYLAEPADPAAAPAIVVVQEWWGVNEQIRGVAERLASAGYVALVPDLFRGKVALEAAEAHHLMTGLNFGAAARTIVLGGVSTQIGVESTARQAYEHGYELLILKDATASSVAEGHEMSMKYILPRLSRLVRSDDITLTSS
jgi:isochorismate hydrolase